MVEERLNRIEEKLDKILIGIDKDESDNGWWETSVGAKFGAKKKQEIKDFMFKLVGESK